MPLVPKHHGSSQNSHYHLRRRAAIDSSHGFSLTSPDSIGISNDERDVVPSLQNVEAELNHAFVLGTGLFLFLILGYLSRRQIRSTISRLRHPLSAYGSASQFIHTHLHIVHYSPLHDQDTITSPIESEGGNVDIESMVHANDEPAPPYSPQPVQVSSMRERRSKKSLHITVPAVQAALSQAGGSDQEQGSSGPTADAESSFNTIPGATSIQAEKVASSRARSLSNAGVLDVAAPIVSKLDAYFRPYRHVSIPSHQVDDKSTAASGGAACLPNVSNRSESLMSTGSPCATPPPQYTITIHSSHRLTRCDSAGRLASVPDIVLSPVPWLPREHVPQSPPHYLAIPSRKSRSRTQRAGLDSKVDLSKTLPATPSSHAEKRSKRVKSAEIKVRHVFSSPVVPQAPAPSHRNVAAVVPVAPTIPKAPKPKQLPRSATYPLQKRVLPPLPPPRPVLPMDLEAVYPTTYQEVDETPAKTEHSSSSGSESTDSWRWPNWPTSGQTVAAPILDRRSPRTEGSTIRASQEPYGTYGSEKGVYTETTKGDWKMGMDNASDSEDVPLAQELLSALRKRKFALETRAGRGVESPAVFDVSQVLRKGLFGGLSALAAKARMVIEQELDSDEEVEEEDSDKERKEKGDIRHRNFVARELEEGSAFVIGEED